MSRAKGCEFESRSPKELDNPVYHRFETENDLVQKLGETMSEEGQSKKSFLLS